MSTDFTTLLLSFLKFAVKLSAGARYVCFNGDEATACVRCMQAVELDHPADVVTRFLFAVGTRKV